MKINVDTHTHTIASGHAYSSIREMAKMAKKHKLEALAITDHAPDMPGAPGLYYFQNLKVMPKKMYDVKMLYGVELNILNEAGEVDLGQELLGHLDIKIASIHTPCFQAEIKKEQITRAYMNTMENPYVDIIGHPDDDRFPIDYPLLVKKAKKTGTLLEINNSSLSPFSFRKNAEENIRKLLSYCKEEGTMVVMGTDAHVDEAVGIYDCSIPIIEELRFPLELIANTSLKKLQANLKNMKSH